ncbi:ABC-type nitrate/sulfonate/bicarbonate transport system, permease component [Gottschalkia purinilytica]|uniref:ABC-type nitrate/sulfonate/bicarbonate transport system, permease component n=1 Tax=Gottschalkia purinilytica TaxID=1503 RepID=A0A0L0WCC2_GOTPU|nr:ABC transporter permease subunit [Gottschalkia purinilytica]KNF09055.1 ABC-type nitrate/sulfonate/bicarbonate transport system, permease component [Gottschalkia purinilytica]
MKKVRFIYETLLPFISSVFALILHAFIPRHEDIMTKDFNYFKWALLVLSIVFLVLAVLSVFNEKLRIKYGYKSWFVAGMILLLNIYNLITEKFMLLPSVYFPFPDKILDVFYSSWPFLLKCLGYSLKLLVTGVIGGAIVGVLTGIAIGWNRKASYWINPLIKLVGPIPATVWIPIALVTFSTSFKASAFIIGISVWFPTAVLTSSGIQNIENAYFEVASTLGSSSIYKIKKIAIPGALPSMFIGFFNGITSAFLTLMTAEMIGVKFGIGWYINWQRETMSYANVYAGLIVIAISCSLVVTLLFRVRDKLLTWQKGVIKW